MKRETFEQRWKESRKGDNAIQFSSDWTKFYEETPGNRIFFFEVKKVSFEDSTEDCVISNSNLHGLTPINLAHTMLLLGDLWRAITGINQRNVSHYDKFNMELERLQTQYETLKRDYDKLLEAVRNEKRKQNKRTK